jgi:hypothetical protein
MAYTAKVLSIVEDGSNIFLEVQVNTGTQTLPIIRPVFKAGTTFATIKTYVDAIVTNAPTLTASLAPLLDRTFTGS